MPASPTILLTRPLADATQSAERFVSRGLNTLIDSLLSFEPDLTAIRDFLPLLHSSQLCILTSKNTVRALGHPLPPSLSVLAVGSETAALASQLLHANITATHESQHALCSYIKQTYKLPNDIRIAYPHGTYFTTSLLNELTNDGYQLVDKSVYNMIQARHFKESTIHALTNQSIQGVCLYSSRSADIFMQLINQHHLADTLQSIYALCLSPAIANLLPADSFKSVLSAAHPTEESLLDCAIHYISS